MSYTDKEMRAFSQIAYADLDKGYEYLASMYPDKTFFSIQEVANATKMLNPNVDLGSLGCLTNEQMNQWKISGVHNKNQKNGFYACIIETEPGNAVVGYRGSENMSDPSNMVNDWVGADVGLVNSVCTNQHAEVDRFLERFQDQLNNYDKVSMTGHSLGGNLAEYATIVSGKYGLDDNISQCVSLDGPGFSNEFILLHLKEINNMKDVMKHYNWSLVGTMLYRLPGVDSKCVDVSNDANEKDNKNMNLVTRHDTKYLLFDENGNLIEGNRDVASIISSCVSKGFDALPPWLGNYYRGYLSSLMISGVFIYDIFLGENGIINRLKNIYEKFIDSEAFKGIKDFIKKIINSNKNYIKVDTRRLTSDVNRVMEMFNEVISNVDKIYEDVQHLNVMWTGSANKAFTDKFAAEHNDIVNYLTKLKQYVGLLEADSKDYNNCESNVLGMIESIHI